MFEIIRTEIGSAKWKLESETVSNVELFPQSYLNIEIFTLALPSLSFCMANEQSLNLNTEQFVLINPENTCSFLDPSLEQP